MEQVLCIPRLRLPREWVSHRSVVPMALDEFIGQCRGFSFLDRSTVEQDPDQKQIIPYVLLQTRDRERTAAYHRNGSEARLHDLWSVGIGGHINPVDEGRDPADLKRILLAGLERELDEELVERPAADPLKFMGVISEDVTPVGSVHLGAVFRLETQTPDIYRPGPELHRFQWKKTGELSGLTLELWSELALELATGQD